MNKITALNELIELQSSFDTEAAHSEAGDILCKLLVSLGYEDVIREYNKIDKWYA